MSDQDSDDTLDGPAIYRAEYPAYRDAVRRAGIVSYGGGGIITEHGRENYASALFAKLAVTGLSLLRLSPDPEDKDFDRAHIDFSGAAALTRVMVDTFIALFHLGLETCDEDEWRVRQLLVFWRDFRVRQKMGVMPQEHVDFHTQNITERLRANPYWQAMGEKRRKYLLKHNEYLHSPWDIAERAGFDMEYHRQMYAYWSAHAHCDSVAFLFMGERNRGMGQINDGDLAMLGQALRYARGLLTNGTNEFDALIVGAEARGNSVQGLDPLNNVMPPITWAGTSIAELRAKAKRMSGD